MRQWTSSRPFGYLVLAMSAVIWGAEGVLAKLCYAHGFSLPAVLFFRYFCSLPVLFLACRLFRAPLLPPRRLLRRMFAVSLLFVGGAAALYVALDLLPATLAILFFYAYPATTGVFCALTGRQAFDLPHVLSLLLSAGGLILLYWNSGAHIPLLGLACALAAALCQTGKLVYGNDLMAQSTVWTFNFFMSLVCSVVYLLYAALGRGDGFVVGASPVGWLYLILLGMAATAFGSLLMFYGLTIVGAVEAALIGLLEPPTTALLAFVVFVELLSPWQMVGGLLILLAVALPPLHDSIRMKKQKLAKETKANE